MELFPLLDSINKTKVNLLDESGRSEEEIERAYPRYMITKLLSYHPDAIMFVNELNIRGKREHGITNRQHYEFFLELLPKKSRFAKIQKAVKEERVELIMNALKYSRDRAVEVVDLFSDEDFEKMRTLEGGQA